MLISERLLAMRFLNMSISFLQCNPTLTITSWQLLSCRSRCRHSKFHWPVKGICLQWVYPKGRLISGKKYSTSSQGWSTPTGALRSTIHPTNLFNFKSRNPKLPNLGVGIRLMRSSFFGPGEQTY